MGRQQNMAYQWQMLTRTNQIPDMLRMMKVLVLKIKHKALLMDYNK